MNKEKDKTVESKGPMDTFFGLSLGSGEVEGLGSMPLRQDVPPILVPKTHFVWSLT